MLEKTLESSLDCKEIQPVHPKGDQVLGVHWKDWRWSWNSNTLATWCEELTHWKRPWCRERWKAGGEGDDRGWDGLDGIINSWTWVWVNSGRAGGRKESDMIERLNWTELNWSNEMMGCQSRVVFSIFNELLGPGSQALCWVDVWVLVENNFFSLIHSHAHINVNNMLYYSYEKIQWHFPGGLVVRTLLFHSM